MNEIKVDLNEICFQNILIYISRTHSLIDFLNTKIISNKQKIFGIFETEEILEAFLIKIICDWEYFIENTIISCISKNTKTLSEYLGLQLPITMTIDECTAILNGFGYFNVKNVTNLKTLSRKILNLKLNPFLNISKENTKTIDNMYILRNYIAHKSKVSYRALLKIYKQDYNINVFVEPGKFLLMHDNKLNHPLYDYFNSHIISFWLAALEIWEYLYPNSFKEITEKDGTFSQNSMNKLTVLVNFRKPEK